MFLFVISVRITFSRTLKGEMTRNVEVHVCLFKQISEVENFN